MRPYISSLMFLIFSVGFYLWSGSAVATESLKCEAGPLTKVFGKAPWLVYGCDDGRSVIVVSAPGNPAMPFYFMFSPDKSGYRLVGEGTGSKDASAAALTELKRLTQSEVMALGAAARSKKSGSP